MTAQSRWECWPWGPHAETPYRFQVPVKLLVLVTYAHRQLKASQQWRQKLWWKVNVALAMSEIRRNSGWKRQLGKGTVVSVLYTERCVGSRLWDLGSKMWSQEGGGDGWLFSPMLVGGFPHYSYLSFCFLSQGQVALCCKQVLTLGSVHGCHKPRMQNGNGEQWSAYQKVPCWYVNLTHRGQSPLFSYFLLRSYTIPHLPLPNLF